MIEADTHMTTKPQRSERLSVAAPLSSSEATGRLPLHPALEPSAPLLSVDDEVSTCARLQRLLTAKGFAVTCVRSMRAALDAAIQTQFAYAIVELRLGRDSGLELIKELHKLHPAIRVVVVTGSDSFASVILALRAGAVDYLPKPVKERELINALLGRTPMLPPVPDTPLGAERMYWEHIQRIFEQCDRNVTKAAQQMGMHRRTLQRILGKRAPSPRRM